MRDFLGYSYISHYNEKQKIGGKQSEEEEENNLVDDPLREIFQWALLMNYRQIAKYVWENMWEPLPAAIVATKILKKLSRKISDNETVRFLNYLYHHLHSNVGVNHRPQI